MPSLSEIKTEYERLINLPPDASAVAKRSRGYEDTLCHDSMTSAERRWLHDNRTPEARHWNLLTDLNVDHLSYVPLAS